MTCYLIGLPTQISKMLLFLVAFFALFFLSTPELVKIDGDALNFVMLGDWGGQSDPPYYTTTEKKVATSMGAKAKEINSQFTVTLGDNFYDGGVESEDDPRFQTTFENIFTASSLQKRWYAVCGNHDHHGNISAQIAYTKKSSRWYMPDLYYTDSFILTNTNTTIQIIFIDTIVLAGMTHPKLRSLPPNGPNLGKKAKKQWKWIKKTMKDSTADWLLVCGHYPVWSISEHGPTKELVDNLRPMLIKYNVSAYFSGHDHDIQHIKEDDINMDYFVSGAGHLTDISTKHEDDIPHKSLKYLYGPFDPTESHGGFNTVSITDKTMVVTFFDSDGNQLYATSITKKTRV